MSIHDTLHRPEDVTVAPIPQDVVEPTRRRARHATPAPQQATSATDGPTEARTGQQPFTISIPAGSFQGVRVVDGEHRPGFFGFLAAQ